MIEENFKFKESIHSCKWKTHCKSFEWIHSTNRSAKDTTT